MIMVVLMDQLVERVEAALAWIGKAASWLNPLLVLLIIIEVVARYWMAMSWIWLGELEWHLFALMFLLGASYTLQHDGHVRVDVLYQRWSPIAKAWVNLLGHLFLLIPLCLFVIPVAWDYFFTAWTRGESSGDPGGLPAIYPIKFLIPAAWVLLLTQAVASAWKATQVIFPRPAPASPGSSSGV